MELILIVEDDDAIAKLLTISLHEYGFKTKHAYDLATAKRDILSHNPLLIILDLGLPDGDGKSLITKVRKQSKTPIIVLSARNDEKEIIAALDLGADDYVTKPFSTSELLARVRSTLRRVQATTARDMLTCKDLTIDFTKKEVQLKGALLKLTPTEYTLLRYLMQNANKVLPHQQILKEVWGVGYQNEMQYLRTYINSLRKKIEDSSTRPEYITTESSIGYRFACHCHDERGNQ
ncbi:response regulator transcription factor [Sulfurospirillum deleyianum]|uniref:Response regulator receiver n=1 Tax=Sulfurospirillum deleyianum (strain ATCC 51133 / DSM 6946 / 5175) TaxID=525898 RepID=D1B309_SULD5|nr:response regulator transcription factor [Sulfurospirillum deleyianum]ACZ12479.1 response regulator receiver [Sulfurospirillum deleyianum DSM 6946]